MQWLPLVALVLALCSWGAYGIQKRKWWAWYVGWVFSFFASGAVAFYTVGILFNADNMRQVLSGIIFTIGGAAVWTFWAAWWSTCRDEFFHNR